MERPGGKGETKTEDVLIQVEQLPIGTHRRRRRRQVPGRDY